MTGERSYVQVPPDSTGKKIRHEPHHRMGFTKVGGQESHIWQLGKEYVITEGLDTYNVTVFRGPTASVTTGNIGVDFTSSDEFNNVEITSAATISYEGTIIANITSDEVIHVPYVAISGGDLPNNTANVDRFGALNTRFADGNPQLDAFGRFRTSEGTSLGDYQFTYDILSRDFSTKLVGNATATHDDNRKALVLTCPTGVPAAGSVDAAEATDSVAHTSNTYHHYFPGFSQEFVATVALSDEGVSGVIRNWGYFDSKNGYFFRCNDTSGLEAVIRTNTGGSVTETVIAKADFNQDAVDGTGTSQFNLDLRQDNIYWIDIQWLGAGRVRFGTYYRGTRIVMHEHYHEGALATALPSSQSGSLPVCFVQKNTNAALATDAKLYAWCASINSEHKVLLKEVGANRLETISKTFDPSNIENAQADGYEVLGALAPVKNIGTSTTPNRSLYLPNYLESMSYIETAGGTGNIGDETLVEVEVYLDPVIGGGSTSFPNVFGDVNPGDPFNAVNVYKASSIALEADRPRFHAKGGHVLATYIRGRHYADLSGLYSNFQDGAFKNYAEDGGTRKCTIATITPGATTSLQIDTANHPVHLHREGYPVKFTGIVGTVGTDPTNGLNYDNVRNNQYFLKLISATEAELYEDDAFTTPVDTTSLAYTSSGIMVGDYGNQMYFVVVCKPLTPTLGAVGTGTITTHFNLGWSQVVQ